LQHTKPCISILIDSFLLSESRPVFFRHSQLFRESRKIKIAIWRTRELQQHDTTRQSATNVLRCSMES
ncbi:unnamed protein product, partial [Brassica oleracea]